MTPGLTSPLYVLAQVTTISLRTIHLRRSPHVRLASTHKAPLPFPTPPAPEDVLESLTLSSALPAPPSTLRSRPQTRPPVFGSFAPSPATTPPVRVQTSTVESGHPLVPDSMEWEPLAPPGAGGQPVALARPRFWPDGARGTGLEEAMGRGMVLGGEDGGEDGEEGMEVEVEGEEGEGTERGKGGWWRW